MSKSNSRFIVPAKSSDAGKAEHKNISIIIPVAGMGSRMKRYGPKCLFPTSSKGSTILSKIIKNIRKVYPYCEVIATVGFDADKVIDSVPKNVRIVENQLYDTTSMVESIRLALNNAVNDDVIIINGDLIFNVFTLQNLTKYGSCVIVDSQNRFNKDEVGVTVIDNMAVNFAYGLPIKWAQIIYLTGRELAKFHEICNDREKNKMHTFEILNMVIESGGVFLANEPKGMQIKEIDSLKDLPRWDK